MTTKRRRFVKGIKLDPDTTALTEEGEVKYDDTAKELQYLDDSTTRSVVSDDGTQTLSNKTMDFTSATGTNTISADSNDIAYDNGVSGLTATNVKAAIDELDAAIEGQDEASEISYDNATSGLTATNVQDAIDEVDGNLDTHIADTTTHGTTGDIVGTSDSQTLTNKTIDADANTITNIEDADIKAGAAINATKIADGSVDNTEFQRLNGVTGDIQTQLDAKLDDFSSTNDERLVRTDGTSGDAVQESVVALTDVGAMSGITQLDVDNIQIDGNTIASTDTNGDVNINPDGTGDIVLTTTSTGETRIAGNNQITGTVTRDVVADAATGANVTLTAPTTKNIRLTNGSLVSIDEIPAGNDGQEIVLINATGNSVTINNDTGSTPANQILTGTQTLIVLNDEASIPLVYNDTKQRWMVAAGVGGDSGSGSLDIFYQEDFEITSFSDLRSGNNGSFLGGGTLQGTLSNETSNPIAGNQSISFVQDAASADDYFALPSGAILLDEKQQGKEVKLTINHSYDGDDDDINLIIYDETGTDILASFGVKSSSSSKRNQYRVFLPPSSSAITIGYQVAVANTGAELIFDDIELSSEQQLEQSTVLTQYLRVQESNGYGSTNDKIRRFVNILDSVGSELFTFNQSAADGDSITINQTGYYDIMYHDAFSGGVNFGISLNSSQLTTNFTSITAADRLSSESTSGANSIACMAWEGELVSGDIIRFHTDGTGTSTADRASFSIAGKVFNNGIIQSTEIPLNEYNAVIAHSGTPTVQSADEDFIVTANLTDNGTGDTSIDISGLNLVEAPAAQATALASNAYASVYQSTTTTISVRTRDNSGTLEDQPFSISINLQGLDRKDLTANLIQTVPKVAYLKYQVSSGTAGGTAVGSDTRTTRPLNTLEGDTDFITLDSDQFTLAPGKYLVDGYCTFYEVNECQCLIRNITDSTDDILGQASYSFSSDTINVPAPVNGSLEISSAKVYEMQYFTSLGRATNGLGAASTFGIDSVFSLLKITKIK